MQFFVVLHDAEQAGGLAAHDRHHAVFEVHRLAAASDEQLLASQLSLAAPAANGELVSAAVESRALMLVDVVIEKHPAGRAINAKNVAPSIRAAEMIIAVCTCPATSGCRAMLSTAMCNSTWAELIVRPLCQVSTAPKRHTAATAKIATRGSAWALSICTCANIAAGAISSTSVA